MENPLLYKFPSRMTYDQALRLTIAASFWSEGRVPFARKLYTGVIQQFVSPIAFMSRTLE
ncbi:hypothetical protein A2U01_0109755, partial [Trifolium medium]|nr:hypothetical protein [Trifolium medium]